MLTLDARLHIPAWVSFTFIDEDAILLNMHTNRYYSLGDVGARLWGLLRDGKTLRESFQVLLDEYEVEPGRLEQDVPVGFVQLFTTLRQARIENLLPAGTNIEVAATGHPQ